MATWKSAAYDGRYLQLDISESVNVVGNSSTLSWTLTSTGGASTYYTIDTTTVTINGTTVYSKERTYWDDRVFPAKKGSVSGTITVAHNSNGSKTIAVGFSTRVYIYGSQEYGGSMTLTTIDRSAPTVTFSTSNEPPLPLPFLFRLLPQMASKSLQTPPQQRISGSTAQTAVRAGRSSQRRHPPAPA